MKYMGTFRIASMIPAKTFDIISPLVTQSNTDYHAVGMTDRNGYSRIVNYQ